MFFNIIKVISLLILLSNIGYSVGTMSINNNFPQINQIISLQYNPDNRFNLERDLFIRIYLFDNQAKLFKTLDTKLNRISNPLSYNSSFEIPDRTVYCLYEVYGTFREKIVYDNNEGDKWEIIIYDSLNKPLENAYYAAAMANLSPAAINIERSIDFRKALEYLQNETNNYPNNFLANVAYISLAFEMQRITRNDFERRLQDLVDTAPEPDSDDGLKALVNALRTLKLNSKADAVNNDYIKKYHLSGIAEDFYFNKLAEAKSMQEFNASSIGFLKQFPDTKYKNRVFSALIQSFLQVRKFNELLNMLDSLVQVPLENYAEAAINYIRNEKIDPDSDIIEKRKLAQNIIEKNVLIYLTDSDKFDELYSKPGVLSESQWIIEKESIKGDIAEIIADFYKYMDDSTTAFKYYLDAIKYRRNNVPIDLYENTIKIALNLKKYEKAFELTNNSILNSNFDNSIINLYKDSYIKIGRDSLLLNAELEALLKDAEYERMVELHLHRLNKSNPASIFKTPDGRIQDFEEIKGKIAVILFWSSWCEPCKLMFKEMESLFENYLDSNNVLIFSINTWERSDDRFTTISEIVKEFNPGFPIFIDEDDILPYRIGFSGLPVTVFIDETGVIRFIEEGFAGSDNYLRMVIDRVKYIGNRTSIEDRITKEAKMIKKY
jgi:cytochrome c biogenesis protein CcmG, thiol:disulfide interchange protein DsbE